MTDLSAAYRMQHAEVYEDIAVMEQSTQVVQQLVNMYVSFEYTMLQHQQSMQQLSAATATVSMNQTILNEVTKTYGVDSIQAIQAQQQLFESMNALRQEQAQAKMANLSYEASLISIGGGGIQAVGGNALLISTLAGLSARVGAGGLAGVLFGDAGAYGAIGATIAATTVASVALVAGIGLGIENVLRFKTATNSWSDAMKEALASLNGLPIGVKQVAEAFTYAGGYIAEFDAGALTQLHDSVQTIIPTMEGWATNVVKLFNSIPEHATTMLSGAQFAMSNLHSTFVKGDDVIQNEIGLLSELFGFGRFGSSSVGGDAKSFLDTIKNTIDSWKPTMSSDWNSFWSGLGVNFSSLKAAVNEGVTALFDGLGNTFNTSFAPLKTDWNDFWNGLPSNLKSIGSTISTDVGNIINPIGSKMQADFAPLKTTWNDFWNTLAPVIEAIRPLIQQREQDIFSGIQSVMSKSFAPLKTDWNDFWSGLPSAVKSIGGTIASDWAAIQSNLKSHFASFGPDVGGAWSTAWTAVVAVVVNAVNAIISPINTFIAGLDKVINAIDAVAKAFHLPTIPTVPTIPTLSAGGGGAQSVAGGSGSANQYYSVMTPSSSSAAASGGAAPTIIVNITVQGSLATTSELAQQIGQIPYQQLARQLR